MKFYLYCGKKFRNNKNSGFTLIELLVVIALLSMMASIVFAALNGARKSAADTSVKSNLANMRAQVELLFGDTGNYSAVCVSTQPQNMFNAAVSASGGTSKCNPAASKWNAWVQLKTDITSAWCVDSTGASRLIPTPGGSGIIASCP